jgi:hypothetical protein
MNLGSEMYMGWVWQLLMLGPSWRCQLVLEDQEVLTFQHSRLHLCFELDLLVVHLQTQTLSKADEVTMGQGE